MWIGLQQKRSISIARNIRKHLQSSAPPGRCRFWKTSGPISVYLQESLATRSWAIFYDYACWAKSFYSHQHLPADYLATSLSVLNEILTQELPPDYTTESDTFIRQSIRKLDACPPEIQSFFLPGNPRSAIARSYLEALLTPDREGARKIINDAVESGVPLREIYLNVLEPVLRETGRLWHAGKISVAKEHYVSASVKLVLARMHDRIVTSPGLKPKGKRVVAACVESEYHEVGIQMVAAFFEMDGWDAYFTGANTPADSILEAVRDHDADVLALSSTMVSDIPLVHYLIRSLHADPTTKKVKIIVGGYPFAIVPGLWKQVGADAFAGNAEEAVAVANQLTS